MADELIKNPETSEPEAPSVDWADLRAQAAKLGISLSQLQQQQREKKLRLERKGKMRNPAEKTVPPAG